MLCFRFRQEYPRDQIVIVTTRHPVENIDHIRTKTRHPQTNGICERFQKTMLNEFYRVVFRKKIYQTLEALQTDLDGRLVE